MMAPGQGLPEIQNAQAALAQMPTAYQKRYGPDLTEAMRRASAQQGVA
jgi:hypothetical protein